MSKAREQIFKIIEKHVDELNKNECSITLIEIADAVARAISSREIPGVGVCDSDCPYIKLTKALAEVGDCTVNVTTERHSDSLEGKEQG